ncbi:MAG: hypothetical protein Q7U66_06790 [Methylobacter sp.]|nr:hypothetical protein [Methylobacter sp.]
MNNCTEEVEQLPKSLLASAARKNKTFILKKISSPKCCELKYLNDLH